MFLDDFQKTAVQEVFDDIIVQWGKDCKLVYPPKMVVCNNCIPDPICQKSSGFWLTGGPIPFTGGTVCPVCRGHGVWEEELSEIVKMFCIFNTADFLLPIPSIDFKVADGLLQTKGMMTDLPKIFRCKYMSFETDVESIHNQTFRLLSEIKDNNNIIQNRYFVVTWQRVSLDHH